MNNENILFDFLEKIWNGKDIESVEKYINPEYRIHIDTGDPWEGKTIGPDEFKTRLNYSFDSFPDMHFSILSSVSDGNYVAITWIMTGTNLGPIGGFPPTNKSIKTNGATIYHFNNGKICGHSQVFDRTTVMKQLGFLQ
jgi:steroid delta-isomerase-like uncharacterized protein